MAEKLLLLDDLDEPDAKAISQVEQVLLQLDSFDPTSEHSRYPVRNDGSETLASLPRVHLRRFHESMERVAHFLDACDIKLREDINTRAEIEEAFRGDYEYE
ncbi:hypothetical protein Aple_095280 [Acrocarpospora pleiomorpha]|uniref:Uncharacterized protein n=2 Tax=Acrocarpospora pleiomorpha TaxID=90975 RepID=A0A5M3Y2Z1_9ACTN|nr:hypothetical protein Aple_095280 [Acrocarpospora pleiomorpha]